MLRTTSLSLVLSLIFLSCASAQLSTGWKAHDLNRPAPTVVTPAKQIGNAPSDAIVLFDGTDLSHWKSGNDQPAKWEIFDGAMESVPKSGFIYTKEEWGDCQLHIEFASPKKVKGSGQGRGNSGVFLMGKFEVQVLDSFENETYADGSAGSVYGQYPPLVNASRGPGEWQTYDIVFRRPRFDESGNLTQRAQITVLHNGVLIQDAVKAFGPTSWIQHQSYDGLKSKTKGPVSLQDHGNPVRYRNIWIRPLAEEPTLPESPYPTAQVAYEESWASKLVGKYGQWPVTWKNGKLYLKQGGQPLEMVPVSKTEFQFTKSAGTAKFTVDEDGNGVSVELSLDAFGGTRTGKRKK